MKRPVIPVIFLSLVAAGVVVPHLLFGPPSPSATPQPAAPAVPGGVGWSGTGPSPASPRRGWSLQDALMHQNPEAMRSILEQGADPNQRGVNGWRPLIQAAITGDPESVDLLLRYGARVDEATDYGWTALHVTHDAETMELLIEHGADVDARSADGRTPLHLAGWYAWDASLVEILLDAGAAADPLDAYGDTPLLLAARKGRLSTLPATVAALVAHGADVTFADAGGNTPADLAAERGLEDLAELLRAEEQARVKSSRTHAGRESHGLGRVGPARRPSRPSAEAQ